MRPAGPPPAARPLTLALRASQTTVAIGTGGKKVLPCQIRIHVPPPKDYMYQVTFTNAQWTKDLERRGGGSEVPPANVVANYLVGYQGGKQTGRTCAHAHNAVYAERTHVVAGSVRGGAPVAAAITT